MVASFRCMVDLRVRYLQALCQHDRSRKLRLVVTCLPIGTSGSGSGSAERSAGKSDSSIGGRKSCVAGAAGGLKAEFPEPADESCGLARILRGGRPSPALGGGTRHTRTEPAARGWTLMPQALEGSCIVYETASKEADPNFVGRFAQQILLQRIHCRVNL